METAKKKCEQWDASTTEAPMSNVTPIRRKRGRKSARETYTGPRYYTGCRQVRMRDGKVVPCGCKSCQVGGW